MFHLMLLGGYLVTHAYVLGRASSVPVIRRRVPRPVLLGAGALLVACWFLGGDDDGAGAVRRALGSFSMNWLAVMFLLATALLAVDLATCFGFLFRRRAPALRGLALLAGGGLAVFALHQGTRPPAIVDYEVRLEGLPKALDGTVLAVLSDLHLGAQLGPDWLEGRVAQVSEMRPDAILLLGDMVEGHGGAPGDFLPALRRLRAPLGVYAVTGNHESHGRDPRGVSLLSDAGFTLLGDRAVAAAPGLVFAGVDDLGTRRRQGLAGDFAGRALDGRPAGATVFLSHSAREVGAAERRGVGLMLSGHTHGGQIWPYGYLMRLVTPYVGGRYEVGRMSLIVSRGTGTWGPRMRLWRPAEILRVTLRAP